MNGCRLATMVGPVLLLFGCASTKVLDEPTLPPEGNPLAVARDQTTTATLDWVIVRNGPGTWSKNADWDQYLLRIENQSNAALVLDETFLEDSTGTKVYPELGRQALRTGSKQVAKRYKDAEVRVKAGTGTAVMAATVNSCHVSGASSSTAHCGSSHPVATTAHVTDVKWRVISGTHLTDAGDMARALTRSLAGSLPGKGGR